MTHENHKSQCCPITVACVLFRFLVTVSFIYCFKSTGCHGNRSYNMKEGHLRMLAKFNPYQKVYQKLATTKDGNWVIVMGFASEIEFERRWKGLDPWCLQRALPLAEAGEVRSITMALGLLYCYLVHSIPLFVPLLLLHTSLSVSAHPIDHYTSQIHQINLRIAHLESVLEESDKKLNEREVYLEECEERMNEMSEKIQHLQSTLSRMKADSLDAERRYKALEEEVQLLWPTLRKSNFDLHILKSKAEETEKKLEEVTSRVEKMGDVVTEQWIQVQHLEQALHITKMRTHKAQRLRGLTRCTFLKFINSLLDDLWALDSYLFGERTTFSSLISQAMDQMKRCSSLTKKYHHQLQGFIKDLMKRNELTASLANDELVFFLASALITFPLMSAWMMLSS
ncbi:hypothetical protein VNO77_21934 [Canavalia gladiata]|uniref:Uncharacterized protein n=1 Tax=Canavalia gladiata TaxID=3824 RepID=A0AAN9L2J5_CANGL